MVCVVFSLNIQDYQNFPQHKKKWTKIAWSATKTLRIDMWICRPLFCYNNIQKISAQIVQFIWLWWYAGCWWWGSSRDVSRTPPCIENKWCELLLGILSLIRNVDISKNRSQNHTITTQQNRISADPVEGTSVSSGFSGVD